MKNLNNENDDDSSSVIGKCACGGKGYLGGWCFKCGKQMAPGKRQQLPPDHTILDRLSRTFGRQLSDMPSGNPNSWNE